MLCCGEDVRIISHFTSFTAWLLEVSSDRILEVSRLYFVYMMPRTKYSVRYACRPFMLCCGEDMPTSHFTVSFLYPYRSCMFDAPEILLDGMIYMYEVGRRPVCSAVMRRFITLYHMSMIRGYRTNTWYFCNNFDQFVLCWWGCAVVSHCIVEVSWKFSHLFETSKCVRWYLCRPFMPFCGRGIGFYRTI